MAIADALNSFGSDFESALTHGIMLDLPGKFYSPKIIHPYNRTQSGNNPFPTAALAGPQRRALSSITAAEPNTAAGINLSFGSKTSPEDINNQLQL